MKHYKELLLKKLSNSGWELVEKSDDTDWWLEEHWKVKSNQQNWGLEIYILFLVDPQYEGTIKSQAIWAIQAVKKIPVQRPIDNEELIEMDLVKGKFDKKLESFIEGINEFRNNTSL